VSSYDYGNARLRAQKSRFLEEGDYLALTAVADVDHLLGALSDTWYRPDVEAALPRYRGLRRLDYALRSHLVRTLQAMRGFYRDEAQQRVDLLLEVWDLRNLRTIFRAQAGAVPAAEVMPLLIPAAKLTDVELAELARQTGVRDVIDLMMAWSIPSLSTARMVLSAWPGYEAGGDVEVLEHALNRAYASRIDEALSDDNDVLARVLRAQIDQINLLVALRIREGRLAGEALPSERSEDRYLPGGRLSFDVLDGIAATDDRERITQRLAAEPMPAEFRVPLSDWATHGSLVELAGDIEAASTRAASGLFSRGDPLDIDVVIAFAATLDNEVRNLRIIGRSLAHGVPPTLVESQLVMLW
jgi:vacuolar-type H+-ATPase subunit C/Vma6